MRNLLFLVCVLFLTACGTATTMVLEPVATNTKFSNVKVVADNPNVEVPQNVTDKLESVIKNGLYEKGPFADGDDLRIHYTFISNNPGNQFTRWFWGGIGNAGEGSLALLVRYLDKNNNEIARTQVEGRIGSGFFGGSFNEAITKAGEDIVKFTVQHFAP